MSSRRWRFTGESGTRVLCYGLHADPDAPRQMTSSTACSPRSTTRRGDRRVHRRSDPHPDGQSARRRLRGLRARSSARGSTQFDSTSNTSPPKASRTHVATSARQRRRRAPGAARPNVHLNGHFDVVPAGAGWTVDPFGGVVRDGRIYGRGACDMKAGIAAAVYAAEAIRRAGVALDGSVEISGTVDEESGGFAGVAWLAEHGRSPARAAPTRHHPRAAQRRSHLHRPSRRLLVRGRRRAAASATAACRSSASTRSSTWASSSSGCGASCCPALAGADDRGSGRAAARAPRHAEHQRHRRRPAGGRHPDAVRRRLVPRGVRSPLPARGGLRRDEGGNRGACSSAPRRHARTSLRAARPDGRASGAHAGRLAGRRRAGAQHRGARPAAVTSPAPAPTITSTSIGSPASRTASPMGPASSISRISRTSGAASTI